MDETMDTESVDTIDHWVDGNMSSNQNQVAQLDDQCNSSKSNRVILTKEPEWETDTNIDDLDTDNNEKTDDKTRWL
jgi:hypothetical protein